MVITSHSNLAEKMKEAAFIGKTNFKVHNVYMCVRV